MNVSANFIGKSGVALVLAAALSLAGCGRRGPLELPPEAGGATKPATAPTVNPLIPNPGKQNEPPTVTPPKTPFFLDPLL